MMKLKILKRICISVISVIFIGILIYALYSIWYYNFGINKYYPEKETTFYRVYGTGRYEPATEDVHGTGGVCKISTTQYTESYIVANAPDNVIGLKRAIEKFEKSVGFEEEAYNKCDEYARIYIKESKDMTRDWKPNNAFIGYDPSEEYHYGRNIIAVTSYSKLTNKTFYNIHPKDSNFKEVDSQQFIE